jgi:predicted ester cyclase
MTQIAKLNGAVTGTPEANKAVVRRVFEEVVNQGRLDVIDEIYSPEVVDHDPLPGAPPGIDGIRYSIGGLRTAFPDFHVTIEAMSAHHDKVVVHNTWRGTQRGRLFGVGGKGRQICSTGIVIWRLVEGRIVERWAMAELAADVREAVA